MLIDILGNPGACSHRILACHAARTAAVMAAIDRGMWPMPVVLGAAKLIARSEFEWIKFEQEAFLVS